MAIKALGMWAATPLVAGLKRGNRSIIMVIDRSGSMSWTLDALAEDCCRQIEGLLDGDLFSFGWFSSPGQFDWALRGFKVSGKPDRESLKKVIRANRTPLGTTCFSGILDSLASVVTALLPFDLPTHFCFLTDGHPVVSNVPREIKESLDAMSRIAPMLATAMIIGYGDYYNKPFLMQMAERAGGELVHASNVRDMAGWLDTFGKTEGVKRVPVRVPAGLPLIMGVEEIDKTVVALAADASNVVEVQPGTLVFFEAAQDEAHDLPVDVWDMGWLALALGYLQRGEVDHALEILQANVGDVHLAQMVASAWTNKEIGHAEDALRRAVANVGARFKEGRQLGKSIDPHALCLLDVLDILAADEQARFFPYAPEFDYQRIGPKSEVDGDWPKFEANKDAGCAFNALVWHDARLNLSLATRISGAVELRGDAAQYGFAARYPTYVFRNYALVKDGHLNVDVLPVEVSRDTYLTLAKHGVAVHPSQVLTELAVTVRCLLDLTVVPIINRAMSEGVTSAAMLARLEWLTLESEGRLKAYNALRKRYAPEDERKMQGLSPEQEVFLATNGIGKNGYSVPTIAGAASDSYTTKELTLQYKGFSSLPSLADVEKRIKEKKAQTASGELVLAGLLKFQVDCSSNSRNAVVDYVGWLDKAIGIERTELRQIRREIQATKFKVVLARRRFDEFNDTADEHTIAVDGRDCRILLREVEQAF